MSSTTEQSIPPADTAPPQEDVDASNMAVIARQAIVDHNRAVYGYELFDRSTASDAHTAASDAALLFNALTYAGSRESLAPVAGTISLVTGDVSDAVVVDELVGQQQVVIKSLAANADPVKGISGATILGDGKVSLILEINELKSLCQPTARATKAA